MARSGQRRESKGQRRRREREAEGARKRAVGIRSTSSYSNTEWQDENGAIGRYVRQQHERTLNAYNANPRLVDQDANQERDLERGGYADRQVLELVQNAADTIYDSGEGTIRLHLARDYLYCADDGTLIDEEGVEALLFAYLSPKRGTDRIGRFGLGFKSVLGVTDAPEFYSRSGSFRWSRQEAAQELQAIVPDLQNYPTLRIAYAFDPGGSANSDPILSDLMGWATNIVRLPLSPDSVAKLQNQLEEFPDEFLLFVPHVRGLEIVDEVSGDSRRMSCDREANKAVLSDGNLSTTWMVANFEHELSAEAIADERTPEDDGRVKTTWAAPIDRLNEPGQFWAYFPTLTQSLLSGILNAPWKTNEDRQNLLTGPFNDELITAAAGMVAESLRELSTIDDPSRHLLALPRRSEDARDNRHAELLSRELYKAASDLEVVPDQRGILQTVDGVKYPPQEIVSDGNNALAAFERWQSFAERPPDWVHHSAINRDRLAKLRLLWGAQHNYPNPRGHLPLVTLAEWLEALTERAKLDNSVTIEAIEASKVAIQTAAQIPSAIRDGEYLGEIVLTADGRWVDPDQDTVFLGGEFAGDADSIVHKNLEDDPETREALLQLGIRSADGAALFEAWANEILRPARGPEELNRRDWDRFWSLAEQVDTETTRDIIVKTADWHDTLHVKTMAGKWRTLHETLLPGLVVPEDGSRDSSVVIETNAYHSEGDVELLRALGASDGSASTFPMAGAERQRIARVRKQDFTRQHQQDHDRRPQESSLLLRHGDVGGPLGVLKLLSDAAASQFTWNLLENDSTYSTWSIRHEVVSCWCGPMSFPSPAIAALRAYGRIATVDGTFPIADGFGDSPANPSVRQRLLEHPNIEQIRLAFDVPETLATAIHEEIEDDVVDDDDPEGSPQDKIAEALRQVIRIKCSSDAERLYEAVGESALLNGLPASLIAILESENGQSLTGIEIAEAAISTFHTGALEEYRGAIARLHPPRRWAGGPKAIAFVQSLGFSEDWAGSRSNRRDPFEQVDGPFTLPELHDYQRRVVGNLRRLLTTPQEMPDRRGMISMPTGSGKTRVAVQAIVESIREDGIRSGVLWVADRDELCEQAVEAWREVWASEGAHATPLRISRMWQGQPAPPHLNEYHVVVASIQTLTARLEQDAYRFLTDFDLIVFDEAHRSIAPSFTGVMEEIGLTRYRRGGEPILVGLTATPYRGHDEEETRRLVNRYGEKRLDAGAFASDVPEDVVRELQDMSVLAQAEHKTIDGGRFALTQEELGEFEKFAFSRLPESVEQRIGQDAVRTRRILKAYHQLIGPEWPTLVFATSVEHSKTVAAMLNREGISARAVWGETKASVRRGIVEDFRRGKIRALVNYGVFREGFDAPKTRAIVVARPVYSPNLYFQMIGRGLRGTRNGGNDRCLIMNVEDNFENYEGRLAFSELDWLWDEP